MTASAARDWHALAAACQPDGRMVIDGQRHQLVVAPNQFEPSTGLCVAGPCRGARLEAIAVEERDGLVQLVDDSPGRQAGSGPSP